MALSATRNMTRLYSCQHTYVVVFRFSLSDCCRVSRPHMAPRKTLDTVSGEEETFTRKKERLFQFSHSRERQAIIVTFPLTPHFFYNRKRICDFESSQNHIFLGQKRTVWPFTLYIGTSSLINIFIEILVRQCNLLARLINIVEHFYCLITAKPLLLPLQVSNFRGCFHQLSNQLSINTLTLLQQAVVFFMASFLVDISDNNRINLQLN